MKTLNVELASNLKSAGAVLVGFADAELPIGQPVDISRCGDCSACVDACPGHAISGVNWMAGISRNSIYDAFACVKTAREFGKIRKGVHDIICGICTVACPWTQNYLGQSR
jgi:epoxyqueuosine reductase